MKIWSSVSIEDNIVKEFKGINYEIIYISSGSTRGKARCFERLTFDRCEEIREKGKLRSQLINAKFYRAWTHSS